MMSTVHYFERQASRERRAAREALTDAARERHASLAEHFAAQAQLAQQKHASSDAVAAGRR